MTEGIFALQTSKDIVPDFVIAKIDFLSKYDLIFSSLTISQFVKYFFLIYDFIKSVCSFVEWKTKIISLRHRYR